MTAIATPEVPAKIDNLAMFDKATHQGFESWVEHQWGEYAKDRKKRGLRIIKTGMTRLALTVGQIVGIGQANKELGSKLADDLVYYLDYLSGYGGFMEEPQFEGMEIPRFITVLYDDNSWGSFSIVWYATVPVQQAIDINKARGWNHEPRQFADSIYKLPFDYGHAFHMNGGLIFHGFDQRPGGAPNFAVNLSRNDRFWSTHT